MRYTHIIWILFFLFLASFLVAQYPNLPDFGPKETQNMNQSPICSTCGRPCTGKYFQLGEDFFCSENCMGKKYFCSSCGVTLGTALNSEFQSIVDIQENELFFCPQCMKKPGCEYCGSRKGTLKTDGLTICSTCRKTAVNQTKDALPILAEAQNLLKKQFGFPINPTLKLEVVSRAEFAKRTGDSNLPAHAQAVHISHMAIFSQLSADQKTLTIELKDVDAGMLVIGGAPRASAFDSIVHELTHDFLRRGGNIIDDQVVEEGFCEAIAGICSTMHGNPTLAGNRFENPDPIYGEGFRKMYGMLEEKGWEKTMDFIKSHTLTQKEYVLKNLYDCIDQSQTEHFRKNHIKPQVIFGKVENANK